MTKKYSISSKLRYTAIAFVLIGIITLGLGFYFKTEKTWANVLLNNYYFIAITIGATFFYAIQYITQSGWSALFQRIPLALSSYLPVAGILILFIIFGMNYIYDWSLPNAASNDAIIRHKSPYLNIPFFFIRLIIYFSLWIFMTKLLLKVSVKEDKIGGLKYFYKSEFYSKIYIFILAITFSLFTFDLIMSIDVHWFSTIFAVKNFVSGFLHGVALITLTIILLNRIGYYKNLNKNHLQNFSKYLFILGFIWVYLWFMEYLLIWFGNIQEESVYFITRLQGKWKIFFFSNIILNWLIPFFVLLLDKATQNKLVLMIVCICLLMGFWIDLYLQIMPGTIGVFNIGLIEIGSFIGYTGLFTLVVTRALSKFPLIPNKHPYLNESLDGSV